MKKDEEKKLILNKSTIANLNLREQRIIIGGAPPPESTDCTGGTTLPTNGCPTKTCAYTCDDPSCRCNNDPNLPGEEMESIVFYECDPHEH